MVEVGGDYLCRGPICLQAVEGLGTPETRRKAERETLSIIDSPYTDREFMEFLWLGVAFAEFSAATYHVSNVRDQLP